MITNILKIKKTVIQSVNEGVSCLITKDLMNCILFFTPAINGGKTLSIDDIQRTISRANVSFGIDEELLDSLQHGREYDYKYVVATGKAPVHGINAEIIPKLCLEQDIPPRMRRHNPGLNVSAGDIIAIKKQSVPGVDGITVTGKRIRHRKARDVNFPKGNNVYVDSAGENLIASCDGILIITNGEYIIHPYETLQK